VARTAGRVSVVVPHYNDPAGLDACLAALARQTRPPDEIVVADNDSPQGEAEIARLVAGRARLIVVPEKGAGPARNGGVAASSGDVLAFTDSDCLPSPEWLAEGLAALERCDFVGGAIRVLVQDETALTPAEAFERVFAFDNRTYVERKGFTATANLICRRDVFDAVGGFRVGVPEDVEWCHRARDAGYRIGYAPAAVVGHPARRTWSELARKWARLTEEGFGLARRRPLGRLRWLVKALALPLSAVAHSPRPLTSRNLARPGDRLKALAMLYRLRFWRAGHALRLMMRRP
jgi:GT2 family glycosyltransferase